MSYRHPNEMKANQELMEKCMHDAVHAALNEIIPSAMEEMESVLEQKMCDLRSSMTELNKTETLPVPQHQDFTKGIYIGLGIGACLFIGLITGLLVAQIL